MAYKQGFEYDIFLSYARLDNGAEKWVDDFDLYLKSALERELGCREQFVRIFRDTKIAGNINFEKSINAALQNSALLLVLFSHNYKISNWCLKELEDFCLFAYKSSAGLELPGHAMRFFMVLQESMGYTEWADPLQDTNPYNFFNEVNEQRFLTSESRFKAQINRLARDMGKTLALLNTLQVPAAVDTGKPFTLFLADVPPALATHKKKLKKYLEQDTVALLKDIPPPREWEEHKSELEQIIPDVDLAVHLLGLNAGQPVYDKEEFTYPQQQYEIVQQKNCPSLLLLSEKLQKLDRIKQEDYRTWVKQSLETATGGGVDVLVEYFSTPEELYQLVKGKIREMRKDRQTDGVVRIGFDNSQQADKKFAARILDYLSDIIAETDFLYERFMELAEVREELFMATDVLLLLEKAPLSWLEKCVKKLGNLAAGCSSTGKQLIRCWVCYPHDREEELNRNFMQLRKSLSHVFNLMSLEKKERVHETLAPLINACNGEVEK